MHTLRLNVQDSVFDKIMKCSHKPLNSEKNICCHIATVSSSPLDDLARCDRKDRDFIELYFRFGAPPKIIIFNYGHKKLF